MIILNNENILTNNQINKIIKFLGKDYKPRKIVIYETIFDIFKYFLKCFNISIEEMTGKLEGSYCQSSDTVFICVFAQDDDDNDLHSKQLYSLHALVHELRHRYQWIKNILTSDVDDEKSEEDADNFAINFINYNSKKIKEIMGWKDEWEIKEED